MPRGNSRLEIIGLKAYKSVKDVPGDIDVAVFAIPAKFVAAAVAECGEKKIPGAVLIPCGFAETGNVEDRRSSSRVMWRSKRRPSIASRTRFRR